MESNLTNALLITLLAIRAAIFIQKWYRQHQARQEMRKRCNWQIFQNLEYASEQDQAEVSNHTQLCRGIFLTVYF